MPGKGRGGGGGRSRQYDEDRRDVSQTGRGGYGRRRDERTGMHKFLAKTALVNRVLRLERGLHWDGQGGGLGGRDLFMNMGLNCKALDEKSQQSKDRHPPVVGRWLGEGASRASHGRFHINVA